jgi:hypothetical protein
MITRDDGHEYRLGRGNWRAFDHPLDDIFEAAEQWRQKLDGVERPWLCWSVNSDWCLVQQKMVSIVGWTPIVGNDPRAGKPKLLGNSIYIDFNKNFNFVSLFPHFVLEFVFLYSDRLAFWHSDLLIRELKMRQVAELFGGLKDGEMAAVIARGGLRNVLRPRFHRYWELLGCTTRGASLDQFNKGCGWWMHFYDHPMCQESAERARRAKYNWEYGTGIMYWARRYGGKVHSLSERFIKEGHCTRINNSNYVPASPVNYARDLSKDLVQNYDLLNVCERLQLTPFLSSTLHARGG